MFRRRTYISALLHLAPEKETSLDLYLVTSGEKSVEMDSSRHFSSESILAISFWVAKCKRVASQQQSKRRLFLTGNADDSGGSFKQDLLVACRCSPAGIQLPRRQWHRILSPFTKSGRGTGEVGAEAAWLDNRDFDAERPEFLGNFGEPFDTPLCRRIGAATSRSDSAAYSS